jgi:hypothetical protein
MKQQLTKSMIAGTLMLTIAGCGSQYDDRPFVMSCNGETVAEQPKGTVMTHYTDKFSYNAGGIPLPTPAEMAARIDEKRLAVDGYFGLRFLTSDEGRLPKVNATTIGITDHRQYVASWEGGDDLYYLERDVNQVWRQYEGLMPPSGKVEVEHYYMGANGDLHPIYFQLTGLYLSSTGAREVIRTTRNAQLGAFIPADAKYAVFKKTWNFNGTEGYENSEPFVSWWATPLVEKFRFRPNDYEKAMENPTALGDYTFWINGGASGGLQRSQFQTHSMPPESAKGYDSVGCFAKAGEPFRYSQFLTLVESKDSNEVGVWVRKPLKNDEPTTMFVGQQEEDLQHLPSNPNDWHGANHYLWKDEDQRKGHIYFPL